MTKISRGLRALGFLVAFALIPVGAHANHDAGLGKSQDNKGSSTTDPLLTQASTDPLLTESVVVTPEPSGLAVLIGAAALAFGRGLRLRAKNENRR